MSEDAAKATLLGAGIWTRQGPATLVVRENAWMVLVPGLRKQVTEAAWEVLGRRPAPEELVDQLVEAGELGSADKLTALLFGVHDGENATLGVKGTTPLAVYSAEGSRQIVGTEDEPMVLAPVEKVRRVAFGDLPPEEPTGAPRVVAGIVPVRGFVHMLVDPDQLEEEERTALAEQVEKDGRSIETEEAKKRRAERPAPKPAPKPATTPSRSSSSSSSTRTSSSSARRPGQTSTSSRQTQPEEPTGPNLFAGLFGDAAAAPSAPAGAAPSAPTGAAPAAGAAEETAGQAPAAAAPSTEAASAEAPSAQDPTARADASASAADAPSSATPNAAAEPTPAAEPAAAAASAESAAPAESAEPAAPSAPAESAEPAEPSAPAESAEPAEPSASAEPTASAESAAPTAAATPSPSEAPAESSSDPAPTGAAPQRPAPAKRRLVSTSLFDRKRPDTPATTPQAAAAPSAPSEPATQPTPDADPAPSAPSAPPAPQAPSAPPASLPARAESPAAPTPAPVDEVDALQSPPTLVAPIDDGDSPERDDPSASAAPAGHATGPAAAARPAPPAPAAAAPATQPAPAAPAPARTTPALPAAGRPAPAAPSGDLENSGAYDDLFGKTVFRRIEDAAVRRSGEDDEDEHEGSAAPGSGAPAAAAEDDVPEETRIPGVPSADEVEETPVQEQTTGDFIDWVPGVGRTAPEIAQAAARRAARPQAAPTAYPQVHMAERPPAPVTGSRPAAGRPEDRRDAAGGDPRAGGSYGAPSPQGAGSPYGTSSPYGRPGQDPRSAAPAPQGRHASAPHPVAPQAGAVPPRTPRPGTPQPAQQQPAPQQQGAPQQAASPPNGPRASAGSPLPAVRPSGGAVALPGLVCRNGHANPPDGTACRVCEEPLAGPTRTVARPPLGAIAVSTGERYVLDRSTIVGRRPRASRVSVHDVPQLVTVPSPQQDISRSHLELRLEGWHVVALDLATTNGTTLHRPGYEPLRLRAREGVLLRDGDLLDLGDDVHLTYGEKA